MDYSKFNPANPRVPEAHSNPNAWRTLQPELYMQMERRSISKNRGYSARLTLGLIAGSMVGAWALQRLSERGRRPPGTLNDEWKKLEDQRDIEMNRNVIQTHTTGQPFSYVPQKVTEEDV